MVKPRKVAAQAQAQANKQQEVSKQESLSLVQNLLRVSVFHTAYLRGLFPEHKFQATTMRNLENMKIRMLAPTCPETKRMNDWIEKDVYEALTAGYLHSLHFCVCKDRDGTDLIEQYTYTFTYTPEGKACLDVRVSNKKKGKTVRNKAPPDPESIRCQVVRMLRMLVEITSTLDRMPEERYLLMKVEYTEDTPDDFGTPNFSPAGPEQLKAHFERSPFSISAGEVDTGHHSVSVRVHSIMDLDDDDAEDGASPDEDKEQDATEEGAAGGAPEAAAEDKRAMSPGNSPENVVEGGDEHEEEQKLKESRRRGRSGGSGHEGNSDNEPMISPDCSPAAAIEASPGIGKLRLAGSLSVSPMLAPNVHTTAPAGVLLVSGKANGSKNSDPGDASAAGRRTPKLGGTPTWLCAQGDDSGRDSRRRHDAGAGGARANKQAMAEDQAVAGKDAKGQDEMAPLDAVQQEKPGMPAQSKAGKRRARKEDAANAGEDVKMTPKPNKHEIEARIQEQTRACEEQATMTVLERLEDHVRG